MKKVLQLIIFSLLAVVLLVAEPVFATVGGPTYVYDLKYNPQDESVYFTEIAESGRGCPPELKKVSLNTNEVSTVYSCDEGEKLLAEDNNYSYGVVGDKIREITAGFKDLSQLNLKSNRITVDIEFVNDEYLEGASDFLLHKNFKATVFQGGQKVATSNLTGCSIDQPFTFAGYAIPGFEKKIMLLVSATEDCFEGGYVGERLLVVGGVDSLDKSYTTNYIKNNSPLVVSEATLVVTEGENVVPEKEPGVENEENSNKNESENSNFYLIVIAVVAIVATAWGFFLRGIVLKKK